MGETTRVPEEQGAPDAFWIRWEYRGLWPTERGPRHLWWGHVSTMAFEDAIKAAPALRDAGFAREYIGGGAMRPLFWERPGYDRAELAEACRHAVEVDVPAMRAALVAQAKARQEKAAAAAEELRTRPARAIEAATESLATRPWAWARAADVEMARLWLADPAGIDASRAATLLKLAGRAEANVGMAEIVMALVHPPEALRATLPGMADDALAACRHMSALDADRARVANRAGWGKATTLRGHILAAREALDVAAASHALALLRRHRRQLPAALAARLFDRQVALAA